MKLSKSITSVALASSIVFGATAALADGMPRYGSIKDAPAPYAAPFSWTGFYVGVNAGYAWGDSQLSTTFGCDVNCPLTAASNAFVGAANSGSVSPDGFTGGIQAGYNLQAGNLVYGVELDFNSFDLNQGIGVTGITPGGTAFASTVGFAADWLFTARARLGLTLSPNLLGYVTGGLAVSELEVSNSFTSTALAPPLMGSSSSSTTKTGWTVGGGIEWALDRNWTFKAEYLYVDFGSVSTAAIVNQTPAVFSNSSMATSADLTSHIARAGINYKF